MVSQVDNDTEKRHLSLALFFEGTGQGVDGNVTNVTRLRDLCTDDADQRLFLESGPGTHFGAYLRGAVRGMDWRLIFHRAKTWFNARIAECAADPAESAVRPAPEIRIFLFGFSRGALIARHFAAWLERQGHAVAYLGLWDTVDATPTLDVSPTLPANVASARHAVARDETRRFFALLPLAGAEELVFPGSHSDVGGLYADNHVVADVALAWIAQGARRAGLRLRKGVRLVQKCDPASARLHSAQESLSNLLGFFDPVVRQLKGIRRHRLCGILRAASHATETQS